MNVFTMGSDLLLWSSPYTSQWIFHHPIQNISKPRDKDSVLITVRDDNSKIVGIQNIKWNGKGQIVKKNIISYKLIKSYDYEFEGVDIKSSSLSLEHEIYDIIPFNTHYFKSIKKEYSRLRNLNGYEFILNDENIFSIFEKYGTTTTESTSIISSSDYKKHLSHIKSYPKITFEGIDFDDDNLSFEQMDAMDSVMEEAREDWSTDIRSYFYENGYLKQNDIRLSETKKGESFISIFYKYSDRKLDMPINIFTNCHVSNLIYNEVFDEIIDYELDIIEKSSKEITILKSASVQAHNGIMKWKYYYDNDRLIKMIVNNLLDGSSKEYTINYK